MGQTPSLEEEKSETSGALLKHDSMEINSKPSPAPSMNISNTPNENTTAAIRPSENSAPLTRQLLLPEPNLPFSIPSSQLIPGLKQCKDMLNEYVIYPNTYPELYRDVSARLKHSLCLCGREGMCMENLVRNMMHDAGFEFLCEEQQNNKKKRNNSDILDTVNKDKKNIAGLTEKLHGDGDTGDNDGGNNNGDGRDNNDQDYRSLGIFIEVNENEEIIKKALIALKKCVQENIPVVVFIKNAHSFNRNFPEFFNFLHQIMRDINTFYDRRNKHQLTSCQQWKNSAPLPVWIIFAITILPSELPAEFYPTFDVIAYARVLKKNQRQQLIHQTLNQIDNIHVCRQFCKFRRSIDESTVGLIIEASAWATSQEIIDFCTSSTQNFIQYIIKNVPSLNRRCSKETLSSDISSYASGIVMWDPNVYYKKALHRVSTESPVCANKIDRSYGDYSLTQEENELPLNFDSKTRNESNLTQNQLSVNSDDTDKKKSFLCIKNHSLKPLSMPFDNFFFIKDKPLDSMSPQKRPRSLNVTACTASDLSVPRNQSSKRARTAETTLDNNGSS